MWNLDRVLAALPEAGLKLAITLAVLAGIALYAAIIYLPIYWANETDEALARKAKGEKAYASFTAKIPTPNVWHRTTNGKFSGLRLSYNGYRLRGRLRALFSGFKPVAAWDVVSNGEFFPPFEIKPLRWLATIFSLGLWRNIYIVGIPRIHDIELYHLRMDKLKHQQPGPDGKTLPGETLKAYDEWTSGHFLGDDLYAIPFQEVELLDGMRITGILLYRGRVVNSVKFRYENKNSFEMTQSLLLAGFNRLARNFVFVVEDEPSDEKVDPASKPKAITEFVEKERQILADMKDDDNVQLKDFLLTTYGFETSEVRIYSADPVGAEAERIRTANVAATVAKKEATAVVAAAQGKAKAVRIQAEADRFRLEQTVGYVASLAGKGSELIKWEQLAKSNLTTYVEGGGGRTAIQVPNSPPPAKAA